MIILTNNLEYRKNKSIFYDTDKFIFYVFEKLVYDFTIVFFNNTGDIINAFELTKSKMIANYRIVNTYYFSIRINDLEINKFPEKITCFIVDNESNNIIYSNKFMIKQNYLYNSIGYRNSYKQNKKGLYVEKYI